MEQTHKIKNLICGPFVGELGWELLSWQPLCRRYFIEAKPERAIVYTKPGRKLLYQFAEVREHGLPDYESECNAWHDLPKHLDEFKKAIADLKEEAKKLNNCALFSPETIKKLNEMMWERGSPDLLHGDEKLAENKVGGLRNFVCLCVRDREMSDFRNLPYENWMELAERLMEIGWPVVFVGAIRNPADWKPPAGSIDLAGRTTIDECLSVIARARLAVGGSSGLLHLASRVGVDHLVWGDSNTTLRYHETNWFGCRVKYLPTGWRPRIEDLFAATRKMLEES